MAYVNRLHACTGWWCSVWSFQVAVHRKYIHLKEPATQRFCYECASRTLPTACFWKPMKLINELPKLNKERTHLADTSRLALFRSRWMMAANVKWLDHSGSVVLEASRGVYMCSQCLWFSEDDSNTVIGKQEQCFIHNIAWNGHAPLQTSALISFQQMCRRASRQAQKSADMNKTLQRWGPG